MKPIEESKAASLRLFEKMKENKEERERGGVMTP